MPDRSHGQADGTTPGGVIEVKFPSCVIARPDPISFYSAYRRWLSRDEGIERDETKEKRDACRG